MLITDILNALLSEPSVFIFVTLRTARFKSSSQKFSFRVTSKVIVENAMKKLRSSKKDN